MANPTTSVTTDPLHRPGPRGTPTAVTCATTLPYGMEAVVRGALGVIDADLDGIALRVKRHGIRRAWHRPCDDPACALRRNTASGWCEGRAAGAGHLYGRRRDLDRCAGDAPITTVDRTRFWVTGRAYDGVPFPRAVPPGTRFVVTLKVPPVVPDAQLPAWRSYHRAKTAGATWVETPEDDVVLVLAHELAHTMQFRHGWRRSEVEAELAGRAGLEAWIAAGRPGMVVG